MNRPSAGEWQSYLYREIPLTVAMDLRVARLDEGGIELAAPLAVNHNDKGTGFAGSLFTAAVLSGWSQVMLLLRDAGLAGEVVVSDTHVRYLKPARSDFRALAPRPEPDVVAGFLARLRDRGRARLPVMVEVVADGETVVAFEGQYAALIKPSPQARKMK